MAINRPRPVCKGLNRLTLVAPTILRKIPNRSKGNTYKYTNNHNHQYLCANTTRMVHISSCSPRICVMIWRSYGRNEYTQYSQAASGQFRNDPTTNASQTKNAKLFLTHSGRDAKTKPKPRSSRQPITIPRTSYTYVHICCCLIIGWCVQEFLTKWCCAAITRMFGCTTFISRSRLAYPFMR